MTPPPLRLVEWVDSAGLPGWNDLDAVAGHHLARCVSVGFVVREDESTVMLAGSIDPAGDYVADVIAIPVVAITRARTL